MSKLDKLRDAVRLHTLWLLSKVLGEDVLTASERESLRKLKLKVEDPIRLVEKAFVLGRLRATRKSSKYKNMKHAELVEEANSASFSKIEELAIKEAKLRAANNVKRLADDIAAGAFDRLSQDLSTAVRSFEMKWPWLLLRRSPIRTWLPPSPRPSRPTGQGTGSALQSQSCTEPRSEGSHWRFLLRWISTQILMELIL
jgi:hypothetical protein